MSTDVPVPVNPSPGPDRQRERAKEYQLTAIAQLSTRGTPPATIAAVTGLSEGYINRLISDGRNETFNKLRDAYQRQNLKVVVGSHHELAEKLDDALTVFGDSLSAQDQRLRFEAAKWVWEQVVPDLNGKNGVDQTDTFQLIINQPHVQTQIGETMTNVAQCLISLREAVVSQDPDAHVKLGIDALTVSPTQLEVEEGSAQIDPTQELKTDLLTELIEREDD